MHPFERAEAVQGTNQLSEWMLQLLGQVLYVRHQHFGGLPVAGVLIKQQRCCEFIKRGSFCVCFFGLDISFLFFLENSGEVC